jgi:hypothetical protein
MKEDFMITNIKMKLNIIPFMCKLGFHKYSKWEVYKKKV